MHALALWPLVALLGHLPALGGVSGAVAAPNYHQRLDRVIGALEEVLGVGLPLHDALRIDLGRVFDEALQTQANKAREREVVGSSEWRVDLRTL